MSSSSFKFFTGALIGAAAGALIGLLFAPRPGSETRRMIADEAARYREKSKESLNTAQGRLTDAMGAVRDKAQEVRGAVCDKAQEVRETVRASAATVQQEARRIAEEVKASGKQVRAHFGERSSEASVEATSQEPVSSHV